MDFAFSAFPCPLGSISLGPVQLASGEKDLSEKHLRLIGLRECKLEIPITSHTPGELFLRS